MGYSTDFYGRFELSKPLDNDTFVFLKKLNESRRMKRDVNKLKELFGDKDYGIEGEFFVEGQGFTGQPHDESIVDYNFPPKTQPGLWCQWIPTDDKSSIEWDLGEKFYYADKWIQYIINRILEPKGYILNGVVNAQGEDREDIWYIEIKNNNVNIVHGRFHQDAPLPEYDEDNYDEDEDE